MSENKTKNLEEDVSFKPPTSDQYQVGKRILAAKKDYELKETLTTFLNLIAIISGTIAPLALSITTGNWGYIFLLLLYPITVLSLSISKSLVDNQFIAIVVLPVIVLNIFSSMINAPIWCWIIPISFIISDHIRFNLLPRAQSKLNMYTEDPAWEQLQSNMDSKSIKE